MKGSPQMDQDREQVVGIFEELKASHDPNDKQLVGMCYETGLICGAAGTSGKTFDLAVAEILKRYRYQPSLAQQHLLLFCIERASLEQEKPNMWPPILRKMKKMQEDIALSSEIEHILGVIHSLMHSHNDIESVDMEVELFKYLKRKHDGDKKTMAQNAVGIIESMDRLGPHSLDILIFSKILRNQVDQGFWKVRTKLRQTIRELEGQGLAQIDIIKHMYNEKDARAILSKRRKSVADTQELLLAFHLERHEALIAPLQLEYKKQNEQFKRKTSFSTFVRTKLLSPQALDHLNRKTKST
mmetsp:Transcript_27841/g.44564  ORF Transcript_27841/g.44564 Transcript_27841/m.44564 type:complete len:299 (-) Transcript_27841:355-1251(-)